MYCKPYNKNGFSKDDEKYHKMKCLVGKLLTLGMIVWKLS